MGARAHQSKRQMSSCEQIFFSFLMKKTVSVSTSQQDVRTKHPLYCNWCRLGGCSRSRGGCQSSWRQVRKRAYAHVPRKGRVSTLLGRRRLLSRLWVRSASYMVQKEGALEGESAPVVPITKQVTQQQGLHFVQSLSCAMPFRCVQKVNLALWKKKRSECRHFNLAFDCERNS